MKVFVAVILAIGSVSALGSGPYLPSGWRPQGPAFFLPGEVQKPAEPIKEVVVFETEASGSDSLQEYGPPKQVSDNVISQSLPDVVTDQTFLIVEDKGAVSAVEAVVEENVEQKSEVVQEQSTEAAAEEKSSVVYERIADIELQADVTTALYAENAKSEEVEIQSEISEETSEVAEINSEVAEVKSEEVEAVTEVFEVKSEIAAVNAKVTEVNSEVAEVKAEVAEVKSETAEVNSEVAELESEVVKSEEVVLKAEEIAATVANVENIEQAVVQEVEAVEVGVKNIAEALVNLESEIKSEQVQSEAVAEIKVNQENSGSEQAPEGFLEYGPPGFREYGPPKGDELLRSAAIQEPSNSVSDSNEVRRRRFSPKFKAPKSKRLH